MTSSVGIVGSSAQSAPPQAAASVAAPASNTSDSSLTSKPLVGSSNTPISPRIVVDPLAGVITQFLSATGQLESQIPSAAVVAYLRAGLTTQGYAKPTPETQAQQSKSNDNTNSSGIVA